MKNSLIILLLALTSTQAFAQHVAKPEYTPDRALRRATEIYERLFKVSDGAEMGNALKEAVAGIHESESYANAPSTVKAILTMSQVWAAEDGLQTSANALPRPFNEAARANEVGSFFRSFADILKEGGIKNNNLKGHPKFVEEMSVTHMNTMVTQHARELQFEKNGKLDPTAETQLEAKQQILETYATAYATGVAPSLILEYRGKHVPESMAKVAALMNHPSSSYYHRGYIRALGGIDSISTEPQTGLKAMNTSAR